MIALPELARPAAVRLPAHPATGRLALFALCGDLVIALDALALHEVRRADDTPTLPDGAGGMIVALDGARFAGWDLGELLGLGSCTDAWAITALAGRGRVGFRIGRCALVEPLPVCRALPRGIFAGTAGGLRRPDAITAGFSLASIPELADRVSGVVVDLARVLAAPQEAAP